MDEMLQKESLRCQELQEQLLELEVQKNNSQLQVRADLCHRSASAKLYDVWAK